MALMPEIRMELMTDEDRVKDMFEKVFLLEYEHRIEMEFIQKRAGAMLCAMDVVKDYRRWLKDQEAK
jgi:hypothetical protein